MLEPHRGTVTRPCAHSAVYGDIALFGSCFKMLHGTRGQRNLEGEMRRNCPKAGHGSWTAALAVPRRPSRTSRCFQRGRPEDRKYAAFRANSAHAHGTHFMASRDGPVTEVSPCSALLCTPSSVYGEYACRVRDDAGAVARAPRLRRPC